MSDQLYIMSADESRVTDDEGAVKAEAIAKTVFDENGRVIVTLASDKAARDYLASYMAELNKAPTAAPVTTLYIARDDALGTNLCEPLPYSRASAVATLSSVAAGQRAENVALADGTDRFKVKRYVAPKPAARTFSESDAISALVVWEAILDAKQESRLPAMEKTFDGSGAATMRDFALNLGVFANQVWDAFTPDFRAAGHSFDWELVPAILDAVRWTQVGYIVGEASDVAADIETLFNAKGR